MPAKSWYPAPGSSVAGGRSKAALPEMTEFAWVDTRGESQPLQPLWNDGERLYCRTWRDDAEGVRHAVMAVLPAAEHPAPTTISRLAHEFALKDYLDGAWAARPLELVHSRGRTLLVLESHSTSALDLLLGKPLELGRFLRLASAIAHAVGQLHERGLVHKDIKPANILLDPVTEQVWLTGFGIASRLPRERQAPEPPEFIAGTLAYMAPEQTGRMNRFIDSRSDLYALGVTFYQMLTGSAAVRGHRSHGMGSLPHRAQAAGSRPAIHRNSISPV